MMRHPTMHPVAIAFFSRFARFEYALKSTDCLLVDADGEVGIDWEKFANREATKEAFKEVRAAEEFREFIEHPPMKRVADSAGRWRVVSRVRSSAELCGSLRRLRNNLFHGDKDHPFEDRDNRLLQAGAIILERLTMVNDDVRYAYERDIDIA